MCGHFGPWSLRTWTWERSVQPVWSLVISVLGHFSPKDRTDLATSVLRKPKLSQCICKVSFCCMFIVYRKLLVNALHRRVTDILLRRKKRTKNVVKTYTCTLDVGPTVLYCEIDIANWHRAWGCKYPTGSRSKAHGKGLGWILAKKRIFMYLQSGGCRCRCISVNRIWRAHCATKKRRKKKLVRHAPISMP